MGKHFRYSKGQGKSMVKIAKENPAFLDELREFGADNAVKYIEATLMNEEIMAYCKEHEDSASLGA